MNHFKTHRRHYGITAVVILLIGLTIFAINRSEHWSFNGTSKITVFAPHDNTSIFIDGKEQAVLAQGESIDLTVRAGTRSILAAATGFWPWNKNVIANQDSALTLAPFLLPIEPKLTEIPSSDQIYAPNVAKIRQATLPTIDKTLVNNTVGLYVDGDVIIATWLGDPNQVPWDFCYHDANETLACNQSIDVVRSITKVRDVSFYPNRNDVIIFAADNGVFAIELNQDEVQNFQSLYQGEAPRFTLTDNQVFILDGTKLFTLAI